MKASPAVANQEMSEQLTLNSLSEVVNGRTTSKEQQKRQLFSTNGKRSVVKTGSQVLADAVIEERTCQYKRQQGCFWTFCHGQNGQKEKCVD